MRRLVVALVLVVVAVSLVGCGGGGDAATSADDSAPGGSSAPPPAPPTADTAADVSGEPIVDGWEEFPRLRGASPAAVEDRLETGQPMMIFFYDPSQSDTDDQRAQINAVMGKYRGLIDLLSYDVSKALDEKAVKDSTTAEYANLTGSLGVTYTPYIVVVNADGYITWRSRGGVDSKLIERAVLRATQ